MLRGVGGGMKPAPCTYPLRWQRDRSLVTFAPPEHGDLRSSRGPGMNHLGCFERGALDAPSQSPAILWAAGALRFRGLPSYSAERTAYPRLIGPQVRKSASPQVRKSAGPG